VSLLLDVTYLNKITSQLRNFQKVRANVFRCSCPICGDSQKHTHKARGYFFEYHNSLVYKCHNCAVSLGFSSFLKDINSLLYNEYLVEKFNRPGKEENQLDFTQYTLEVKSCELPSLMELPSEHYVVSYIESRKIPFSQYSRLYFCEDWGVWAHRVIDEKYDKPNDHRIVLPFYDQNGYFVGAQGRALAGDKKMRYVTAKNSQVPHMIFGLDAWNKFTTTYVVEGPIDSLFLPNCLAIASSDLVSVFKRLPELNRDKVVLVFDNEPFSKEITSLMSHAIDLGIAVCIWPTAVKQKDINDMILAKLNPEQIIKENTFSGLLAQTKFAFWRKA
jgi:hypothetical protein